MKHPVQLIYYEWNTLYHLPKLRERPRCPTIADRSGNARGLIFLGAKYFVFFSSRSLKRREKYVSLLSLYIF